MPKYEYKFIKVKSSWNSERDYRKQIRVEAKEGWRLVQVLKPYRFISVLGYAHYYDIILEREILQERE